MHATFRIGVVAFLTAVVGGGFGAPALGQISGVSPGEYRCETGTALGFARFIRTRSNCIRSCFVRARQTSGPYDDCFIPSGATATCVQGAENAARSALVARCSADCPECYSSPVCTTGEPFVTGVSTALNGFTGLVFCSEANGPFVQNAIAHCEDTVASALIRFGARKIHCYEVCFRNMYKGRIPDFSCSPPVPTDAQLAACINRVEAKAIAAIDAACSGAGAVPACHVFTTGTEWVQFMESALDGQVPNVACGD
jgi:hypothetical protein